VSQTSGRTRRRVEVRREEILESAIAEVGRVGLAAVRVSDVAAALGISTGLVFYHFRTKDELVAAAFTYAVQRDLAKMAKAATGPGTVRERVRAVLRVYGPTGSATGWRLWIDGWALAQHEPVIAAQFRHLEALSRHTVRSLVHDGLADGTISCSDPDASVSRLLALLDGLSVAAEVFGTVSRAQLRAWLDGAIAAELGGNLAEPTPGPRPSGRTARLSY
jgi:AcrR family transcriptional regulator